MVLSIPNVHHPGPTRKLYDDMILSGHAGLEVNQRFLSGLKVVFNDLCGPKTVASGLLQS